MWIWKYKKEEKSYEGFVYIKKHSWCIRSRSRFKNAFECIEKIVGEENVYVVDVEVSETVCREEKYIAYGKYHGILDRLNRCLGGNTYLFSNKIIGDICQLIKNESISFVFVDDSYYGNLVKTIKEKCDAVAVVTFFSWCQGRVV